MRKLLNQGRSTASPTKGVSGLTEHAEIMVLVAIVLKDGNTSTKGENQLMRVTIGRPGMTRFFYAWSYGSLVKIHLLFINKSRITTVGRAFAFFGTLISRGLWGDYGRFHNCLKKRQRIKSRITLGLGSYATLYDSGCF